METQKEGVKGEGNHQENEAKEEEDDDDDDDEYVVRRETGVSGRWSDRVTGGCQGLKDVFGSF